MNKKAIIAIMIVIIVAALVVWAVIYAPNIMGPCCACIGYRNIDEPTDQANE